MKALAARHRALAIQFLKFGTVGFIGFFVDVAYFHIGFDLLHFGHYGSAFFSFPFAATFGWIGNRLFTFRGEHKGHAGAQWMRFMIVTSCGIVLNRGTYSLLVYTVPLVYQYPVLGLMAGTGVAMFSNFFFARRLVFR